VKTWIAEVKVWLKPSVFDPQGNAVEQALVALGQTSFSDVRIGKCMTLRVSAEDENAARAKLDEACQTVLCNPVVETYAYELALLEEANV
jgi:phosphoribosylformylglycinamidine synthase subunit PurS